MHKNENSSIRLKRCGRHHQSDVGGCAECDVILLDSALRLGHTAEGLYVNTLYLCIKNHINMCECVCVCVLMLTLVSAAAFSFRQ